MDELEHRRLLDLAVERFAPGTPMRDASDSLRRQQLVEEIAALPTGGDSYTVRFSKSNSEADKEIEEWDRILHPERYPNEEV